MRASERQSVRVYVFCFYSILVLFGSGRACSKHTNIVVYLVGKNHGNAREWIMWCETMVHMLCNTFYFRVLNEHYYYLRTENISPPKWRKSHLAVVVRRRKTVRVKAAKRAHDCRQRLLNEPLRARQIWNNLSLSVGVRTFNFRWRHLTHCVYKLRGLLLLFHLESGASASAHGFRYSILFNFLLRLCAVRVCLKFHWRKLAKANTINKFCLYERFQPIPGN